MHTGFTWYWGGYIYFVFNTDIFIFNKGFLSFTLIQRLNIHKKIFLLKDFLLLWIGNNEKEISPFFFLKKHFFDDWRFICHYN